MPKDKWLAYRQARGPLPAHYWLWPLYGKGLENLGHHDAPIQVPLQEPGPGQLLVRHDAVGLCFSDTKVIHAGGEHPRLYGRNLREHPVVLGHEVALTVVAVGEGLEGSFHVGDRFIIQADIYYKGVGLAYGYALQGGLSQYNLVGEEILNGDEGCYLLPLAEHVGYAQGALTEPWACVVAAYRIQYRTAWKPQGRVLIIGGPRIPTHVALGVPYDPAGPPESVYTLNLPKSLQALLEEQGASRGFRVVSLASWEGLAGQTFDDIVLVGADNALYQAAEPLAANGALINIVGEENLQGRVPVDVGRLHYDHIGLMGTPEPNIAAGYAPIRSEFKPRGCMLLLGAAGPMGQMHFQRALQAPESPRLIVATSRVMERLGLLPIKFARLIEARREATRVAIHAMEGTSPETFCRVLLDETEGRGYDDAIVLAPSADVVTQAADLMAQGGVINIFAGLPRGTKAAIPLKDFIARGIRMIGSSGSTIADLRHMLEETASGRIDPNLSVVAVAGLSAAKEGLAGVMEQRFPGKVVIYPQVLDFPLTWLADLKERLPHVYEKLGPNASWTVEAEEAFLEELLP